MQIFDEFVLSRYSGNLFRDMLFELLDDEKIKHANDYWKRANKGVRFDKSKMANYAEEECVKNEKNDLHRYVVQFANDLRSDSMIVDVHPSKSKEFGMSDYIYIDFKKPDDPRLQDFYKNHEKDYKAVKARFSDHKESSKTPEDRKSKIKVKIYNKTFIDASREMKAEIEAYENRLKQMEDDYLASLENGENRELASESIKLKISERVLLDERLEDIGNSTYCTDSAQDIANWIVNKPMPYRVIYDKKYDVWCIADAEVQTHKDMSIDMFDSNYLYGIAKDLDNDIELMRKEDNLNDGWTDAEAYSDYQFDHYNIKGLIFIPENMKYRDYEESGFYSAKTELVNGTIFTTRHSEFSDSGIFKSLYLKLKIMGAIKPEIEALWKKALLLKFDSDKMLNWFYDTAGKHGYSDTEISRFIDDHLIDYLK